MLYSPYEAYNRFPNLDSIEGKLVNHLVDSDSHFAGTIWKLLKYATPDALAKPDLTKEERKALVSDGNDPTEKRVFLVPFIDDAWQEQCSSMYIYVDKIAPSDHLKASVTVNIEVVVHTQIAVILGDGDPITNDHANPSESDSQGNVVVDHKSRATTLLKNVLAEFNGLYVDGVGYLQFNNLLSSRELAKDNLWNSRSFYGFCVSFGTFMSGVSDGDNRNLGY